MGRFRALQGLAIEIIIGEKLYWNSSFFLFLKRKAQSFVLRSFFRIQTRSTHKKMFVSGSETQVVSKKMVVLFCVDNSFVYKICDTIRQIFKYQWVLPRSSLCAPVFLGPTTRKPGRCAPLPAHRSFADLSGE
jgi:hypothetical protein